MNILNMRGSAEGYKKDGNHQDISAGSCEDSHAIVGRDVALDHVAEEEHREAHQTIWFVEEDAMQKSENQSLCRYEMSDLPLFGL